tara:strand:- start:1248 stop:1439 length:192 start_codon:yes stop_codon:yes gene_type:complete
MIRNPTVTENMTLTVILKDGRQFEKKDITDQPFGEHERVVSFWDGEVVKVFPMAEVAEYHLNF